VPHIFTDNAGLWASGREISIPKPLNPERGWNYGASIQQYFPLFHENARLIVDFFRTDFQNQVVVDRESAHMLSFYNLEGRSYAHAFQIEQMAEVVHGLEITAAYKWNDVRMTYQSGTKRMPFVPRHRGLITATYNTPNKLWSFDITAQFIGQSRIPDVSENSSATNWTNTSKPYTQLFAQVTRNHRDWAFYIGGENLGNFTQKNPIISVNDPYHPNFDATMVWGPIYGAMGYVGLRWSWNPKTKIQ
jgi:outer membrane receptor protein involved in Fe transport